MKRRYLSFDIETAKDFPGEAYDWRSHRPLGISCAATLASDTAHLQLWHGRGRNGQPAKRMSRSDAAGLVEYLHTMAAAGYVILTWNGLGVDFDVLAEESGEAARCRECALGHVDMMFHVFCRQGYPVALDKAAAGLGLPGKPEGMDGSMAPKLWAKRRYQEVLDYVAQDVRIALEIAQACEGLKEFRWLTRKGTTSKMALPKGWLSVQNALQLPEPDTSWMPRPMSRRDFTDWLQTA